MRLTFHLRQPFTKALVLAEAVRKGAARHGDQIEIERGFETVREGGLVMFGIGGMSRSIYDAYHQAGRPIVFFDKGYSRGACLRVAVNDFQPLSYFQQVPRPRDRLRALDLHPHPYQLRGDAILLDGASNKFCLWKRLGDWLSWGEQMIAKIARASDRPIIYRPRPSHNGAVQLPGAQLSTGPLADDFARSALVVSYGGNIGFDAVVAGVPHFAIGDSIARPLSETDWAKVGQPFYPDEAARGQWLADVAYCQWGLSEIESGEAWSEIKRVMLA